MSLYFIKHYRHYLIGRKFLLRTDHGALTWLFKFTELEGQVARWKEALSSIQFDIHHGPGRLHGNLDGLFMILFRDSCKKCNPERLTINTNHKKQEGTKVLIKELEGQAQEGQDHRETEEERRQHSAEERLSARKTLLKRKKRGRLGRN